MDNLMDIENLNIKIDKIKMLQNEEIIIIDDIKKTLNEMYNYYNLKLNDKFLNHDKILCDNLKKITINQEKNIYVIEKNIESNIKISREISKKFSEII